MGRFGTASRAATLTFLALFLIISFSSVFGQNLNVQISGVLREGSIRSEIFRSSLLFPPGQSIEIFTGPYTVRLTAQKSSQSNYDITTDLYGLGPDYHIAAFNLNLAIGDSFPIPPQPVKGADSIAYKIYLLDDTSAVISHEEPPDDTTAWSTSETVHYRTHWLKGSYADYLWNMKMGYLENVYNRYRGTLGLSSSEKIEYYLHPDAWTSAYLNPRTDYAIQPRKWRIDLVYGRNRDVATPRPAAEILIYKQWGYGPRWMATGFAGYYEDNFLKMRKLTALYKPSQLAGKFADEEWVESDTGRIVVGAFSRWLADKNIFSKFMDLYKRSTSLNFKSEFEKVYGRSFDKAAAEFLNFIKSYKPKEVELEYYASEYLARGDYEQARDYFKEAAGVPKGHPRFGNQLVLSEYWLGNYAAADRDLAPDTSGPNCDNDILRMNIQVAGGAVEPRQAYGRLADLVGCADALEALATYYLDRGQVDSAAVTMDKVNINDRTSAEYLLALGRLKVMQGRSADSTLAMAVAVSMGRAQSQPQEPVNYYLAGQAFLLMKRYNQAKQDLDISNFLEKRPYFRGCTNLELGKLADLEGKRDEATNYYYDVLGGKSGAYQIALAKKYLENAYEIK